ESYSKRCAYGLDVSNAGRIRAIAPEKRRNERSINMPIRTLLRVRTEAMSLDPRNAQVLRTHVALRLGTPVDHYSHGQPSMGVCSRSSHFQFLECVDDEVGAVAGRPARCIQHQVVQRRVRRILEEMVLDESGAFAVGIVNPLRRLIWQEVHA